MLLSFPCIVFDAFEFFSFLKTQVLNPKTRLVRCQAVCDDASPSPPPPSLSTDPNKPASVVIKESLEGDMSAEIVRSSPNVSQVVGTFRLS